MAMGLVIFMGFTESVLFHSVQASVYNMALKRNSATDAPNNAVRKGRGVASIMVQSAIPD